MATLSIVVPCCPRPGLTLTDTINNIRHGGFRELHLSLEPDCTWAETAPDDFGLCVRQNDFKYGFLTHGMICWKWIYETTESDYLMMVENDVRFAHSAASRLHTLFNREAERSLGFISLFTPDMTTYSQVHPSQIVDGWADQRVGYGAEAGQCICLRREILGRMIRNFDFLPVDWYIGRYCKDNDLPCWHAYPSMAEHISEFSVRQGTAWIAHKGLNYKDEA
ncbi:MAG: hypothetical protein V4719_07530 [Planctomycetota bacterium]